jgi:hypothetical protein
MAILGTINKQAREILDFDINYDTVLAGRSDTIATQTSEVAPSGLTLVSTTRSGNVVKVTFSGGTNTTLYKVTVLATTTVGLVYEDEVNVLIGDV